MKKCAQRFSKKNSHNVHNIHIFTLTYKTKWQQNCFPTKNYTRLVRCRRATVEPRRKKKIANESTSLFYYGSPKYRWSSMDTIDIFFCKLSDTRKVNQTSFFSSFTYAIHKKILDNEHSFVRSCRIIIVILFFALSSSEVERTKKNVKEIRFSIRRTHIRNGLMITSK